MKYVGRGGLIVESENLSVNVTDDRRHKSLGSEPDEESLHSPAPFVDIK